MTDPDPNLLTELDPDRVVATLQVLGVRYIYAEPGALPYEAVSTPTLLAALIRHEAVRVQYAIIPLLLAHPEMADAVPEVAARLPGEYAELLRRHYTVAVYLQRMHRPALEIYLSPKPNLPDLFSDEMGLPSPDEYYGQIGLQELVSRLPPPVDWWNTYQDPVRMFIRALSLERTYAERQASGARDLY